MANEIIKAERANSIDPLPIAERPATPITRRAGVPGFAVTNGYVLPLDTDGRLTNRERYKTFSENLVNVSIIATGVRYYLDLCAGAQWTFEPADEDSKEAEDAAEFMQSVFDDMETPLSRVVKRGSMFKYYGFSTQEWTAKPRDDGRIGLADIEPRPQITVERWDVDDRGWVRGIVQRNPNTGREIYIQRDKLLYVVDDSLFDSPEGLGIFRHATRTAAAIKRFEDLEHWGFETDLQGIPVGRAPLHWLEEEVNAGRMTEADAAAHKAVLANFIANHVRGPKTGMLLDSRTYETTDERQAPSNQRLWDLELLKSGGTSHAQLNEAIKRKTFELARLMGIESLLLGADGSGSLALHKSASSRLHAMINSCLDEIEDALQKQIVRKLCLLNNISDDLRPKIRHEKVEFRTVEEVTGALSAMAQAGAPLMPDDPAIGEVRDLVGLSRPELVGELSDLMGMQGGKPGSMDDDDLGNALRADEEKRRGTMRGGRVDPARILDDLASYLGERKKVPA